MVVEIIRKNFFLLIMTQMITDILWITVRIDLDNI